jgi:hypothetical protein
MAQNMETLLLIIIIPPESLPNSEFCFFFGPRAFNFKNRAEIAATATMTVSVTDLSPESS